MIVDDPRTSALDSLIEEIPDDTVEAPEEYVWEYRALCYMTERLDYDRYSVATAYPEKLAALTETGGWQVDRVLRAGIFARQIDLYPDSDVLDRAVDRAGQSVMRFSGSARPAHRQHWTTFKERISHALMGNNSWQKTLFAWLDETAIQAPDADVHCHVYNPCDLMAALVYGWPDRLQFYVPGLRAGVDAPPPDGRMLQGVLTWTGNTKEVQRVIRTVYAEPGDWAMSRTLGEAWRYDLRLLKALGLRYSLFEWSEGYPNGALLKIDRTRLRRRAPDAIDASGAPTWRSLRQLPEFVSAHWRQLDDVMGEFREHVDIDLGAGVQITW
jgi:hypothetical protein